jgi:hypothetical protein
LRRLNQRDRSDEHEEQNSLGLARAARICVEIEGVIDVQREHLGGADHRAVLLKMNG